MKPGFEELKRLFGADRVEEEFRVPPTINESGEKWCYVVEIPPDSMLLPKPPQSEMDILSAASRMAGVLENNLDLSWHFMDTRVHVPEAVGNTVHITDIAPRRFIFIQDEIEEPENVAALKNITVEKLTQAAAALNNNSIEDLSQILRRASHGIRWELLSDNEGDYFQTVKPLQRPEAVQMAILTSLGNADTHWISPKAHKARISKAALREGDIEQLMESEFAPRPTFAIIPRSNETTSLNPTRR